MIDIDLVQHSFPETETCKTRQSDLSIIFGSGLESNKTPLKLWQCPERRKRLVYFLFWIIFWQPLIYVAWCRLKKKKEKNIFHEWIHLQLMFLPWCFSAMKTKQSNLKRSSPTRLQDIWGLAMGKWCLGSFHLSHLCDPTSSNKCRICLQTTSNIPDWRFQLSFYYKHLPIFLFTERANNVVEQTDDLAKSPI